MRLLGVPESPLRSGLRTAAGFLALLIAVVMVTSGLGQTQPAGPTVLPAPPRVFIDTSYRPPTGRTIPVARGGDFQGALKAAQAGDVIVLEPGALFQGNFSLPKKTGTGWIVVRSGASDEKLPPPGTRMTPDLSPLMPKLVSPNSNPALYTEPAAHHYRFIGIEFTIAPTVKDIYSIVSFGGEQTSDVDTPSDLILDRCYVHGQPGTMSRRGILLNSAASAVVESYVSEIHALGADSQAILGYNGPGPFKIVNNFLEAAGENILFGGADPKIRDMVPSDIEIRRNHLFKPVSWGPGAPRSAGTRWTLKNLLELKNAQRVVVEGNLLENMWGGAALVLTPRNQDGTAPWSVVRDILFRSNLVKNASSGFSLQTSDDEHPSQPTARIAIVNNAWGVTQTFFGVTTGRGGLGEDLLVDHNTAIPGGYSAYYIEASHPPAMSRFRLTNNIMSFGSFGVSSPRGDPKFLPGAVIARNVLVSMADTGDGQGAARNRPPDIDQAMYRSFPDVVTAGLNSDGTLTAKSPARGSATDGTDIGVDFDELLRAYSGQPPKN